MNSLDFHYLYLAGFVGILLLTVFTRPIVYLIKKPVSESGKEVKDAVNELLIRVIRTAGVIVLLLGVLPAIATLKAEYARQISQTGVTILLAIFLVYLFQLFLLYKFGRTKEIEGETVRYETYQSEVFSLLGIVLALIVSILVVINIWGITDWLQATSVLGGILLLIYSTKDVWVPDHINGLMLLYNGDVEPGSVVKVNELDLLGVTLRITLIQAVFRDLRGGHRIIVPNSKLRNSRIDVLSKSSGSGLRQFVDFKIGYGFASETIEEFLLKVWENACEREAAINDEKPPAIKLQEAGDHAITWRMVYSLKNIYRLISAQCAINRAAYDLSLQENIGLNTPLTHEVTIRKKPKAITDIIKE